jgi:WD repeat-containing protein 1 (actin-interacting protein 1)
MASIAEKEPLLLAGVFPPLPAVERGVPANISASADGTMLIYTQGHNVVVRSVEDLGSSFVYQEHKENTTCAQFSPSGHYIASADSGGKLRVWSWTNPEHILKNECSLMPKGINDLCWDSESKRIAVAGDGKMKAMCVSFDTGSDLGNGMVGHTKPALSIAYRPSRPFRIASAGEDMAVMFYEGPPFKWKHSNKKVHGSFINCVRYAPNGALFSTCASDKKLAFYDGATGELKFEIPEAHAGSLYSCAWSRDSAQVLTASADKTVKLWDVETAKCLNTFTFDDKPSIEHMQNSCCVAGDKFLSLGLSGDISFLDPKSGERPARVIQGHNGIISALSYDSSSKAFATSGSHGAVCVWNDDGVARRMSGTPHTNAVAVALSGTKVYSGGHDNVVRIGDPSTATYTNEVALSEQPIRNGIAACISNPTVAVVAKKDGLVLIRDGNSCAEKVFAGFEATSVAISSDGSEVMVGGSDKKIHRYAVTNDVIEDGVVLGDASGVIRALAYSPNGAYLAIGTDDREVKIWSFADSKYLVSGYWKYHTARVTCLSWAPNSTNLASGSTDSCVIIWDITKKLKKVKYMNVHNNGDVQGVAWLDETTVLSTGMDSVVKKMTVTMP